MEVVRVFSTNSNGFEQLVREEWHVNGQRSKKDGPALVLYDHRQITKEEWYNDGKLHRNGGPASITYDASNEPASITYDTRCEEEQRVYEEAWFIDGVRHRDDGPAVKRYYEGNLIEAYWYKHGQINRDYDAPAFVKYDVKGKITQEIWALKGKIHRIGGPAISKYKNGSIVENMWYNDWKLYRHMRYGDEDGAVEVALDEENGEDGR